MTRTGDDEQAKYAEWIAELEARRDGLGRDRRWINVLFVLALITSPLGFLASAWVALIIASFWIAMAVVGRYLIMMYRWDYALQIEHARADAERLAHYRAHPEELELPQDADDAVRAPYAKYRIPRQAVWRPLTSRTPR